MKGISDFLAKFKVIPNPKDEKRIIASIVSDIISQEVTEDSIEIQSYYIKINMHPAFKSLIFQKKESILELINKRFNGEKTFKNIS